MRVDGPGSGGPKKVGDKPASGRAKVEQGSQKPPARETTVPSGVVVSSRASEVAAQVVARVEEGKSAVAEKIQTVKLQVEKGKYKPDLDKLAHRIYEEEFADGRPSRDGGRGGRRG